MNRRSFIRSLSSAVMGVVAVVYVPLAALDFEEATSEQATFLRNADCLGAVIDVW